MFVMPPMIRNRPKSRPIVSMSIALSGSRIAALSRVLQKVYTMPTAIRLRQIRPFVMSGLEGRKDAPISRAIIPTRSTVGT